MYVCNGGTPLRIHVHDAARLFCSQKGRLLEVQGQLQSSVEAREKAEEQCKTLRERNSELERALQKSQLESTSMIDELKLKVRIY